MSSLCHPHCPHIIPIALRRSPYGSHGCGLCCLRGLHPMLSLWSPCCPRCPHIIPIILTSSLCSPPSSPCCPCHSHIIPIAPKRFPMWSPWLWSLWSPLSPPPCCPHGPHIIPVIPTLSACHPCSPPHYLEGPYTISNPPDTHSIHPHPWGMGGPESVKMQ